MHKQLPGTAGQVFPSSSRPRTTAFHAVDRGSNPLGNANRTQKPCSSRCKAFFVGPSRPLHQNMPSSCSFVSVLGLWHKITQRHPRLRQIQRPSPPAARARLSSACAMLLPTLTACTAVYAMLLPASRVVSCLSAKLHLSRKPPNRVMHVLFKSIYCCKYSITWYS